MTNHSITSDIRYSRYYETDSPHLSTRIILKNDKELQTLFSLRMSEQSLVSVASTTLPFLS